MAVHSVSRREGATVQELWNPEAEGEGKPRLIFVERAEGTSSKRESRSNMQDVQRTSAQEPRLGSRDTPGVPEGSGGKGHDADQAVVHIHGKGKQNGLHFRSAQLFAENPPVERVDELEFGEVRGQKRWPNPLHNSCSSGGVGIGHVEREKKAGVGVDDQKRSRSAASCSAPETFTRFLPKVFF